ncbi:MAG: ArsR/SmtB family transcription factor [bacterium]
MKSNDLLTTLAEPRRQQILQLIWNSELAAGEIAANTDVTFGAVSQHLRILREAGAVSMTKRGRHHFYVANKPALGSLAEYFESLWSTHLVRLKHLAEAEEQTP